MAGLMVPTTKRGEAHEAHEAHEVTMSGPHDASYKTLFSHREMVEDLLRRFVPDEWVEHVDFDTLERVQSSAVVPDLRERVSDIVWRLRVRGAWVYVYLLIEFQSSVEQMMAVRVLVYKGLLLLDLVKAKQVPASGPLPTVVPIVIYNGSGRWTAPLDAADLFEDPVPGTESYGLQGRYLAIEAGAYPHAPTDEDKNLVAALFAIESGPDVEAVGKIILALSQWIAEPEHRTLREAFATWLRRVFLPRRLPEADLGVTNSLQEVGQMLTERVAEWTRVWRQEGREEGREEGLATAVLRFIEVRFGPPSTEVAARVHEAEDHELLAMIDRSVDAPSAEHIVGLGGTNGAT